MSDANDSPTLIDDPARVAEIAAEVRAAGGFCFDLEFVSEGRFIPELAVLQIGWGDPAAPAVAAVDCAALAPEALFEVIADPDVETVAHAAKQDLGLLAARHQVRAHGFYDTQIAAAFLGIADQIGYGKLVSRLLDVQLDKGAQFTNWLERPLSARQLRYALDDVRYLVPLWAALRARLDDAGRLGWVAEESAALAVSESIVVGPEEAWRTVKGAGAMRGKAFGALRALAQWRMEKAHKSNKPLGWILPDKALVQAARSGVRSEKDLRAIRGIGDGIVRRHGKGILDAVRRGHRLTGDDVNPPPPPPSVSARGQVWVPIVAAIVQARCADASISSRFVATKADAEALVAWFESGAGESAADLPLLRSWRRELAGEAALAWLRGDTAVRADARSELGIRLVGEGARPGSGVDDPPT